MTILIIEEEMDRLTENVRSLMNQVDYYHEVIQLRSLTQEEIANFIHILGEIEVLKIQVKNLLSDYKSMKGE